MKDSEAVELGELFQKFTLVQAQRDRKERSEMILDFKLL